MKGPEMVLRERLLLNKVTERIQRIENRVDDYKMKDALPPNQVNGLFNKALYSSPEEVKEYLRDRLKSSIEGKGWARVVDNKTLAQRLIEDIDNLADGAKEICRSAAEKVNKIWQTNLSSSSFENFHHRLVVEFLSRLVVIYKIRRTDDETRIEP